MAPTVARQLRTPFPVKSAQTRDSDRSILSGSHSAHLFTQVIGL